MDPVISMWPTVKAMAARWVRKDSAHYDDLCQAGMMGVMTAHSKFDPRRGLTFGAYARYWADAYMRRTQFFPRESMTLNIVPPHDDVENVDRIVSDEPMQDVRFEACAVSAEVRSVLAKLRKRIGPIGWDVIQRRLMDDEATLEDIGRAHGVSREYVRQLERRVKALLARHLEALNAA